MYPSSTRNRHTSTSSVDVGRKKQEQLEMWANAQRDGRPAEYRWRPLFNAAKFGWRPLLECRAVTLPRRETRWNLQGCPKLANRSQPLAGRLTILWGHVEEILLLNKFFSDCRYMPQLRRYSPTNLWDGAQMATFWRFLRAVFSAGHVSDLHSKFTLRPHHVRKYGRHPISDRWDYRRGKKRKKKPQDENIYGLPIT